MSHHDGNEITNFVGDVLLREIERFVQTERFSEDGYCVYVCVDESLNVIDIQIARN